MKWGICAYKLNLFKRGMKSFTFLLVTPSLLLYCGSSQAFVLTATIPFNVTKSSFTSHFENSPRALSSHKISHPASCFREKAAGFEMTSETMHQAKTNFTPGNVHKKSQRTDNHTAQSGNRPIENVFDFKSLALLPTARVRNDYRLASQFLQNV